MTKEILRRQSLSIGLETTPGTAVSATHSIPVTKFNLKHVLEKIKDVSSFGIIDQQSDSHIAKEMSELDASGIVRSQTIGVLLKMALGTAGSATLVETGVYTHAFTRANTNAHPTATVYRDGQNADERAPFHVLESLEIDAKVGEYVMFNLATKGGKIESASYSPSYLTGSGVDEQFLASKCTVKFASDISGLSGASATSLQSVKFTIKKNSDQIFVLGSTTLNANVNQQFQVSGDFEAIYDANTTRDLFTAGTKKAMQIEIEGNVLIGATKYNKITIQLAQCEFDTWERSDGLDNIITETVGFTSEYSFTDTQTMNVVLQNKRATDY